MKSKWVHRLANAEIDFLSVFVTLWTVKWQNYEIIFSLDLY